MIPIMWYPLIGYISSCESNIEQSPVHFYGTVTPLRSSISGYTLEMTGKGTGDMISQWICSAYFLFLNSAFLCSGILVHFVKYFRKSCLCTFFDVLTRITGDFCMLITMIYQFFHCDFFIRPTEFFLDLIFLSWISLHVHLMSPHQFSIILTIVIMMKLFTMKFWTFLIILPIL